MDDAGLILDNSKLEELVSLSFAPANHVECAESGRVCRIQSGGRGGPPTYPDAGTSSEKFSGPVLEQTALYSLKLGMKPARLPPRRTGLPGQRIFACGTMPLVGGFSRGSPVSPAPSLRRCSILTSITLIGSQDLAVESRPDLFTHSNHTRQQNGVAGRLVTYSPAGITNRIKAFAHSLARPCCFVSVYLFYSVIERGVVSAWRRAGDSCIGKSQRHCRGATGSCNTRRGHTRTVSYKLTTVSTVVMEPETARLEAVCYSRTVKENDVIKMSRDSTRKLRQVFREAGQSVAGIDDVRGDRAGESCGFPDVNTT
ncbi:hypothetical protein PR048_029054 [Dryococelus australis]|uniref:Uncharacterized protein n=1 Tax=Dryococelus australis TaxID=614101 RepID=A0ABQ9GF22_9NEOP|nr:hypothetical protein PR048_029054 [Dryococelus australis]